MTNDSARYRTLIHGEIVQETGLSVGGAAGAEGTDSCYRDGCGRLTIPGTSLAGQLIETAARIFPNLVSDTNTTRLLGRKITAKQRRLPEVLEHDEERRFRQSVWRFEHAHPTTHAGNPRPEWRQGVGIRQATGASAGEKGALYDFEFVPAGTRWCFVLEIDTHRGGEAAEAIAVLALAEWVRGYGWLGRGAARGTGWFNVDPSPIQVLRLDKTPDVVELWPDNRLTSLQAMAKVRSKAECPSWEVALGNATEMANQRARDGKDPKWRRGDWHYLSFHVNLAPGPAQNGYGWDVLQVGGHPAVELVSHQDDPLPPLSVAPQYAGEQGTAEGENLRHWRQVDGVFKGADAPFVATHGNAAPRPQPYLPGGGLRGPLRHTASRLERAKKADGQRSAIRDPNWKDDPEATKLKEQTRRANGPVYDADVRPLSDVVAQLFGVEELAGRILIRDALLVGRDFQLARVDHHAEDEFTAGVYGHGKFDRNVLLSGPLEFRIVVEGPSRDELKQSLQPLLPVLDLAAWGHVPIGGGKWRGAGWLKWNIDEIQLRRIGDEEAVAPRESEPEARTSPSQRIEALWSLRSEDSCNAGTTSIPPKSG
ncbi:MAG: RAMP superfamily CRISPR-associated protein [Planctomycetota bacterium]